MPYKDILVFLDATGDTPTRLDLAITLAGQHEARLLGVDVSTPAAFEGQWKDQATGLQDLFLTRLGRAGLDGEFRVADRSTGSWKALYAHFADLVVATQRHESNAEFVLPAVPRDVLLSAGVPVLILPPDWRPQPVGRNIVLAWNASREATRAVHDALPLLARAEKVTLFEFAPPADRIESAPRLMADHLRRHGVEAELFTWPDLDDTSPVDALFSCLDRQGSDLIVAGAYGHSPLAEGLLGGVSEDLIHNVSMPLLMSH
ncbi:universal stress protein [Inquilinus sp. OTU3971]|uniref:universal stress protein n=1 Tax=Inquilinus sp. OTU3971 TaxID=3043855 RepID=UPI00313DCEE8